MIQQMSPFALAPLVATQRHGSRVLLPVDRRRGTGLLSMAERQGAL
jgi:hypothetical protein